VKEQVTEVYEEQKIEDTEDGFPCNHFVALIRHAERADKVKSYKKKINNPNDAPITQVGV